MNGASLCNSLLLHSRFKSPCSIASSSSPSSLYLNSPCFTTSAYISFPHRFRTIVIKRSHGFRSFALNKRTEDYDVEDEEEDEDWDEFEDEGDEDEDEGEFLPMEKMKRWLEKKPRGFGVGKKYETLIEDKLLDEIEQSWKAQAANLNKLKNDPLNKLKREDNKGETQSGFRVRVTNLPKKKNVHRDLKAAFKEVSGVLNIEPAVSGNKKTKDPVCKGFALVGFKTEVDANRFVEQFDGQRLSFGKVVKQIKCQAVEFSSNQSVSEELCSDTVFEELPFPGLEAVSSVGVVEEDAFVDSWEEESSDDSDEDVDETEVEEEEDERIIESPKVQTSVRSQKQAVKRETRKQEEVETPLVSFQAVNKFEEAVVAEALVDDHDDDEHDWSDEEEEVDEENLEPLKSSVLSSDEERIERIRRLELQLLGREKLLGGGAGSDKPEAKTGGRVEGEKKKEKKKKKKILVKGKKSSNIEIPGSSKRLRVKEKALLTGVLVKYAAKAASTSNDE